MFRMFRPLSSAFRDWAQFAAGQGRDIVELPGFSGVSWILFLMLYTVYTYQPYSSGYGSKLGTPKLWMVNTKLDIHICGSLGLPFWPTSIYIHQSQPFIQTQRDSSFRLNSRCWNQFLRGNATEDVSPSWISRIVLRILSQAIHQHLFEVDPMLSTNIFNLGARRTEKKKNWKETWRIQALLWTMSSSSIISYTYIYIDIYT